LTQTTLYSGVLAKIGAERSKLLKEAKLKTLTECKNLTELTAQLRDTSYQAQILKVPLPLTSRKLERAFNEHLIETHAKIIKHSPKKAAKYLDLYFLRLEVENIKTLLKATNANQSTEQKLVKVYLSVEDYLQNRAVIEEAAKASSLRQVANVFKNTEYALALNMGLQSYEESGSTMRLDVFLDKLFYEKLFNGYTSLPQNEKPHAQFYARMENDGFTLLTLLRGKALNHDANWLRLTIPSENFNLSAETVETLVSAGDFEFALKIALESKYASFFVKAQNPEETIANAEKAFKRAVFQHAKASRVTETFNIGVALAFLTQKDAEVYNLTVLSLGVEAAMKPEDIQSKLLV